jgi:hypothetical protein
MKWKHRISPEVVGRPDLSQLDVMRDRAQSLWKFDHLGEFTILKFIK